MGMGARWSRGSKSCLTAAKDQYWGGVAWFSDSCLMGLSWALGHVN